MRMQLSIALFLSMTTTPIFAETQMWVAVDKANRRTCPSTECGSVGDLLYRESAKVAEIKKGWGRVSRYYDAYCVNGHSKYVDFGRNECTAGNGILKGQMAEWVRMDLLSPKRPRDPSQGASGTAKLVAQSDDFRRYRTEFIAAAEKLMSSGRCSAHDLMNTGGFIKSTRKGPGVYFTYCGGGSDQIYLDVRTGKIS